MAAVSSPPSPPVSVPECPPGAPVKPRPVRPVRPDQELYTPPSLRPRRPAQDEVRPRLYVQLKGVRRKLFGNTVTCFLCERETDQRTAVPVRVPGSPGAVACPRCAVCKACGTMRPGPDGKHEEYVTEGGRVVHKRCMRCIYCGKTGVDHPTKRKHVGCSRKNAGLVKLY
jgi:hypothetical protein